MRTKIYLVMGYGTLIADAYLVLASIATRMMQAEYSHLLPPFGSFNQGNELSRVIVLVIATWTAILAMGCLAAARHKSKDAPAPGSLWFVVVLVLAWLSYLTPALKTLCSQLFIRGL